MADYKEKLDELHQAARRRARELDDKLNVKGMVEGGVRAAGDAARLGARSIANGAEQLRTEAERLAAENNLREAAEDAKRQAREAGKIIRDAANDAGKTLRNSGPVGQKAGEVFDEAFGYASTATKMAGKGIRATRASAAAT